MRTEVLRIEDVTIEINGIIYLKDFNMHIFQGEIMGLIGIDGHGQEQLIQLIKDNMSLLYGRVYYREELVNTYRKDARESNRIYVIGQQSTLIPDLSVADNVFVLRKGFRKYIINRKVLRLQVTYHMKAVGIQVDPDMQAAKLNPFERCIIELVKATMMGTGLIVINEINEVLSSIELPKFQDFMRFYAKEGHAFLYICNHHEEVMNIADRFSLVREGTVVKIMHKDEMTINHIETFASYAADNNTLPPVQNEESILELVEIETENLHGFSCAFHVGECVTIFDRNNTTFKDIIELVRGEKEEVEGQIRLHQRNIHLPKHKKKLHREIAVICDNPTENLLFHDLNYIENLSFLVDQKIGRSKISYRILDSIIKEYQEELGEELYCEEIDSLPSKSLYNLVYYRILLYHPKVVFIIQPFLGADMYLRVHIATLINRLKQDGITVVILAVHMADTLAVSDRLLIIEEGRLSKNQSEQEKELIKENYYGTRYESRTNHS